jgi:hypothetical protein
LPKSEWRPATFADLDLPAIAAVLAIALVLLVVGIISFKRLEPAYAKVL